MCVCVVNLTSSDLACCSTRQLICYDAAASGAPRYYESLKLT